MIKPKTFIIAVIGPSGLRDEHLCEAFLLMSQNLEEALWVMVEAKIYCDIAPYPLKFSFSDQTFIFRRPTDTKPSLIRDELLAISDGVVVSLAKRALDIKYLDRSAHWGETAYLKQLVQAAFEVKRPVVLAVEDIKDSFEPVFLPVNENIHDENLLELKPPTDIIVADDIWDPSSQTIQSIRRILKIPSSTPVLPYSYRKPITIQNILTRLIAEIDKQG